MCVAPYRLLPRMPNCQGMALKAQKCTYTTWWQRGSGLQSMVCKELAVTVLAEARTRTLRITGQAL